MSLLPREFRTERLLIRQLRLGDAETAYEEYATDPEVAPFVRWEPYTSIEPFRDFHRLRISEMEAGGAGKVYSLILHSDPDRVIGGMFVKPEDCRAEVGYVLSRRLWGQGLMTEAVTAAIDQTFANVPDVWRMFATTSLENPASRRVLEKSGMRVEGVLRRYLRLTYSPDPADVHMLAITRDDWAIS